MRARAPVLLQGDRGPAPLPPPHGPWLGALLAAWALAVSLAQWLTPAEWQQLAFHASFFTAEVVFLRGAWRQRARASDPRTAAVVERAFLLYALALLSWAADNGLCAQLRAATSLATGGLVPYPHLHALGWHGLIALASMLLMIGGTAERAEVLGARVW